MGTLFVAYGKESSRKPVLEFAAQRAAATGDDLFVYHIREQEDPPDDRLRTEVGEAMRRTAPDVDFEVSIDDLDTQEGEYERSRVSKRKQLLDTIMAEDCDYEYVVMGNVEQGPIEEFVLSSMSEAVLDTQRIPVLLVPVTTDLTMEA